MEGILLVDKPAGMTSHDVINRIRRLTGEKRVGHAGTLDPFATGLLLVAVTRIATRELSKFVGLPKTYEATFVLGAHSDSHDIDGVITPGKDATSCIEADIVEAMAKLTGDIAQIPPMHSAIKQGGKKLYELARAGKTVERPPRRVTISRFELQNLRVQSNGTLEIDVIIDCSSGTYIRAMARDLGEQLGVGGYVRILRRTQIGPFSITDAHTLEELNTKSAQLPLKSVDECLGALLK